MDPPIPDQRNGDKDSDRRYCGLVERTEKRKHDRELKRKKRAPFAWELLEQVNDQFLLDNYSDDLDLDIQNVSLSETAEPPSDLILPLLRYQKEWLAWSIKQEQSKIKGGILADEMGMGKTVQAIALVLAQRELQKATRDSSISSSSPSTSQKLPVVKGTLVVCPLVGAMQWFREIERCTTKGSNKTLVYYGPNREKCMYKLAEYDFVITTYSTIEADYRPKKSKKNSKNSKPQVEISTEKLSDDGSIDKSVSVGEDVPRRNSVLHSVKWNRIILDEAHYIKSVRSNTTKAILALESSYKWALTGTPLENHIGELYSFVRFLQVKPYAYYFCKDCDCIALDISMFFDKFYSFYKCSECSHIRGLHFLWWKRYIEQPLELHYDNGRRDAMVLLKHKILKRLLLRRTKNERAVDLALPTKIVTIRKDSLDVCEYEYYKSFYSRSRSLFDRFVQDGTLRNNYLHIFVMITRLRQAVNHRYLVTYSGVEFSSGNNEAGDVEQLCRLCQDAVEDPAVDHCGNKEAGDVEQSCGLCQDAVEDPVVTSCKHVFCRARLIDFDRSMGKMSCPSCTEPLTFDFTANNDKGDSTSKPTVKGFWSSSILNKIQLKEEFKTSTKIEALREEIQSMVERDCSAKGIVFSQFTSFLDLIQYALNGSDVKCVQLVGSMSIAARDAAVKTFTEDADCRILLMSLKGGGVSLNLTVASNVFLMDPWWNPAVEQQAQDRIHRIGQYKPVNIVRFVIKDTIEEKILELQEKKKLLVEGTLDGSSEALEKLTVDDLESLF